MSLLKHNLAAMKVIGQIRNYHSAIEAPNCYFTGIPRVSQFNFRDSALAGFGDVAKAAPIILERALPALESLGLKLLAEGSSIGKATQILGGAGSRIERFAATEELLSSARIVLNDRKFWTQAPKVPTIAGYADVPGGLPHPVIVRHADPANNRAFKELAAYGLHKVSPFENAVPVSIMRKDSLGRDVLVQERIGQSMFDRSKMLARREGSHDVEGVFNRLLRSSDDFANQTEHAVAQKAMLGDNDTHMGNLSLATLRGQIVVGNIDWGNAFMLTRAPFYPRIAAFEGRAILPGTLGKIEEFNDILLSRQTKPLFDQLSLTKKHVDTIVSRGSFMLKHRRFSTPMDL